MNSKWNQMNKGDIFVFGNYVPASMAEKECEKMPVTWRVMEKEEGRMLVLSEEILDLQPYHHEDVCLRWEDCDLRKWLNTEFLNAAFTEEEQLLICHPEEKEDCGDYILWQLFGMETVTSDISDRIFLLSQADIMTLFTGEDPFYPGAEAEGTEYVKRMDDGDLCWWLRSSMNSFAAAKIISPCASIGASMIRESNCQGIRPAMWLKL